MSEASSSRNHLNSLIRFLRLRGPLAEDRMAQMLHVLVLALAVWYAAWSVILLPLYPDVVARLQVALVAEAAPMATLVLLRVGRLKQACLVYLAATWLATTLRLALSGGVRAPRRCITLHCRFWRRGFLGIGPHYGLPAYALPAH